MSILPWHRDKMIGFDIESTGTDVFNDRIITASVVYVAGVLRPKTYNWVINPGIEIPDEAAAVHGWTTERLNAHPAAMDPDTAVFEILGVLARSMVHGIPLVAMNAAFDLTMLETEADRYDIDTLGSRLPNGIRPVIDPMVLDKQVDPWRPGKCDGHQKRAPRCTCGAQGKKLVDLCLHYGVLLGDAHTADADATAACRLVTRLVERKTVLQGYDLEQLHDAQVGWRIGQQDSLAAYFDKQGTVHDGCCGEWPVHSSCAPARQAVSA